MKSQRVFMARTRLCWRGICALEGPYIHLSLDGIVGFIGRFKPIERHPATRTAGRGGRRGDSRAVVKDSLHHASVHVRVDSDLVHLAKLALVTEHQRATGTVAAALQATVHHGKAEVEVDTHTRVLILTTLQDVDTESVEAKLLSLNEVGELRVNLCVHARESGFLGWQRHVRAVDAQALEFWYELLSERKVLIKAQVPPKRDDRVWITTLHPCVHHFASGIENLIGVFRSEGARHGVDLLLSLAEAGTAETS
mmetsp:Transcript_1154/g.2195  ORF Transcript_1154/g.2195 Transcript_1154/m.2195 type:complete len:253 (+) Transcript_1154:329-1087(+)